MSPLSSSPPLLFLFFFLNLPFSCIVVHLSLCENGETWSPKNEGRRKAGDSESAISDSAKLDAHASTQTLVHSDTSSDMLTVFMCSHGCEVNQTLFSLSHSFSFRYQRLQPTPMVSPGKTFTHTACRCKQACTAVPHFLSPGKQALPLLLSFQGCIKLAAYCAFDIWFICSRSCLSKILSS